MPGSRSVTQLLTAKFPVPPAIAAPPPTELGLLAVYGGMPRAMEERNTIRAFVASLLAMLVTTIDAIALTRSMCSGSVAAQLVRLARWRGNVRASPGRVQFEK